MSDLDWKIKRVADLSIKSGAGSGHDAAVVAALREIQKRLDDLAGTPDAPSASSEGEEGWSDDALRAAGDGLREIARSERCRCWKTSGPCRRCAALAAWRAATGEDA